VATFLPAWPSNGLDSFFRAAESGPLKPEIDLRLAHEVLDSDAHAERVAAYLDLVIAWATRTANRDLEARAQAIRDRFA